MTAEQRMSDAPTTELDEQRDIWNQWLKSRQMQSVSPHHRARGKFAVEMLRGLGLAQPKILEIGCANGWLTQVLKTLGPTVGTDLSDVAIVAAATENPDVRFVAGDFINVDLGSRDFDVIVCLETIAYMDQEAFVPRAASLLRPGGYLILCTPNWPIWGRTGWTRQLTGKIVAKHFSIRSLRQLLSRSFRIVRCTTILTDGMGGHSGVFRLANSHKLNSLMRSILGADRLEAVRGRLGLGETIFVLAQPKPAGSSSSA